MCSLDKKEAMSLAVKFVTDMSDNGFMSYLGKEYKDRQIERYFKLFTSEKPYEHINYVTVNTSNLLKYCKWTLNETKNYVIACGYKCYLVSYKDED